MKDNNSQKFHDYVTFPRTFEKYKWYKPILVLVVGIIFYFILQEIIFLIFGQIYGLETLSAAIYGRYETVNTTDIGSYISYLSVAIFIPSLYIASRIVRDRPFSSYSSSRGGWNWKLYFKCLTIPLVVYIIYAILMILHGKTISSEISSLPLVLCLILIPLQCIAEEYVFRGFVMQTLGSWFKIPILAYIIQAIIFAAMHPYDLTGIASIFIFGVIFGFLTLKTNGLEASSALHSINNLTIFYLVAFGFDRLSSSVTITEVVTMIIPIISAALLYYIGNNKGWFSENT